MTKQKVNKQAIVLDADVLLHFSKGSTILALRELYPQYEKWILPIARAEVRSQVARNDLNTAIQWGVIKTIEFDESHELMYREFLDIQRNFLIDEGEAQCLAFLRFNHHVLGSSNISDIHKYCYKYGITYLTTMDFLSEAMRKNIMSEEECDKFISNVRKESRLPCNYMFEYKNPTFLD